LQNKIATLASKQRQERREVPLLLMNQPRGKMTFSLFTLGTFHLCDVPPPRELHLTASAPLAASCFN